MNNSKSKIVLITGASSGIGRELAYLIAEKECHGILDARSGNVLHQIVNDIISLGGSADHFSVDLSDETATGLFIKELMVKYPKIDVLINNAGIGWYGHFEQLSWKETRRMIDLNITSPVRLTRSVIPWMVQNKKGHIINISSIVGDLPVQGAVLYSSTKAFVNSFTKAISRELNGTGVFVTLIKPGPVATEFYNRSELNNGQRIPGERFAISARDAAHRIMKSIDHPKRVVYIPGYFFFMPWIDRFFGPVIQWLGPILLKQK
jgi:short-subunit dehydrogenase